MSRLRNKQAVAEIQGQLNDQYEYLMYFQTYRKKKDHYLKHDYHRCRAPRREHRLRAR